MKATIPVDHRVSDGLEAAQPEVQALAKYLEEPLRLLVKITLYPSAEGACNCPLHFHIFGVTNRYSHRHD